jgi:hypothetical protein
MPQNGGDGVAVAAKLGKTARHSLAQAVRSAMWKAGFRPKPGRT